MKSEIAEEVQLILQKGGKQPHLVAILVGHDGGSEFKVIHPQMRALQVEQGRAAVLPAEQGSVLGWIDRGQRETADLGQKARARFRCRYRNQRYQVPSRTVIREVLTRVDPEPLDRALQAWNARYAASDEALAIDGKTICNAIDDDGRQTHILSVVGHQTRVCYTQKKSAPSL